MGMPWPLQREECLACLAIVDLDQVMPLLRIDFIIESKCGQLLAIRAERGIDKILPESLGRWRHGGKVQEGKRLAFRLHIPNPDTPGNPEAFAAVLGAPPQAILRAHHGEPAAVRTEGQGSWR